MVVRTRWVKVVGSDNPRIVATELRRKGKVSDTWWQMFQERQRKIKAPTDADPMTEKKQPKVVRLSRSTA